MTFLEENASTHTYSIHYFLRYFCLLSFFVVVVFVVVVVAISWAAPVAYGGSQARG